MFSEKGKPVQKAQWIAYKPTGLPVLASGDLVVAGGSFAGIAAAVAAARQGLRVTLIEPHTYLGREASATQRHWFELRGKNEQSLAGLIRSTLQAAGTPPVDGLVPLWISALKTYLEDALIEAGVTWIYASQPVGLVHEEGRLAGIVIGNKSGRQVIGAARAIDATETALLARLAGVPFHQTRRRERYTRTLEFDQVGEIQPGLLPIPEGMGTEIQEVSLIPGARGEGHVFVECPLTFEGPPDDALAWTGLEIQAREQTMAAAAFLLKQVPAFSGAYLAGSGAIVDGPLSPPVEQSDGGQEPWYEPVPGLHLLNDAVFLDEDRRAWMRDPINAAGAGEALGNALGEMPSTEGSRWYSIPLRGERLTGLAIREPDSPQLGKAYPRQVAGEALVPVIAGYDVLVVGGGTSGATAARIAGRAGARTLVVEWNTGLGGTGTIGGVHSYWFGRRTGFAREVIETVEREHGRLGLKPPQGSLLKWNIDAKMHALLRGGLEAGNTILFGAAAVGAIVEGRRVRGVISATPYGPLALLADAVVDATGDGDVAAFAGAEFVYGAERDRITMWYSLAQFYRPGQTKNNFTSSVDVGNIEDYTRAILAGRRRAAGHDAGSYVAPRESRHILGEVVLTLNDQLLKRCWEDTVSIAFSNHDVKGHTASDWVRTGLIPPNLEIEIPYRALLPKTIEGLLITGKAISATHDAQPAVRMQPDLENLGGVVGLAAAMAAASKVLPREIDVHALQRQLVELRILPESILTRELEAWQPDDADIRATAHRMDPNKPLSSYQDMELDAVFEDDIPLVQLCCAGPRAAVVLESMLETAQGPQRLLLARALALVGSRAGVPTLIEAIHAETPDEGLQRLSGHIRHANLPPDQGAMPTVVNLIYALGMTRDPRALPVWEHFAELVVEANEDDLRDRNLGLFYYVDSLCYGAERLGDARAIPMLRRMHQSPLFHNRLSRERYETDFFLERQAYLELVIARALARCGDSGGLRTLAAYLVDKRAPLAEHAHSELRAFSNQDFGKDPAPWQAWIDAANHHSVPVTDLPEATQAWGEKIYLCGAQHPDLGQRHGDDQNSGSETG